VRALLDDAWQMAESSHDQRALAETAWNLAQITGVMWEEDLTSALRHGQLALSLARTGHDQELEGRCLYSLGVIHLLVGDFEEAIYCAQASLALYARLTNKPLPSRELSLPSFLIGAPLTQRLTNRASEAMCWTLLAHAQLNTGQVQLSIRNGRRGLALAQESKNVWAQVSSMLGLTQGLLEAGQYEEALGLMQHTRALVQTLPQGIVFHRFLTVFASVYHAMQQWDEAGSALTEAGVIAETIDLGPVRVPILSQLCMHSAAIGEWETAYQFALKAIALRTRADAPLIMLDFYRQYETEALLRGRDEGQARAAVQRLGERLGNNRRFRLPYLRSLAVLAEWEGQSEQAISHLHEVAQIAADLGLPAEQWQIQARLARLYEAGGEPVQAHSAWAKAATMIQGLAQGIGDEALRARFLAGLQTQQVVQQAQSEVSPVPQDHAEQNGR
jgi:tetratricopeptide (TPR) repeat protein